MARRSFGSVLRTLPPLASYAFLGSWACGTGFPPWRAYASSRWRRYGVHGVPPRLLSIDSPVFGTKAIEPCTNAASSPTSRACTSLAFSPLRDVVGVPPRVGRDANTSSRTSHPYAETGCDIACGRPGALARTVWSASAGPDSRISQASRSLLITFRLLRWSSTSAAHPGHRRRRAALSSFSKAATRIRVPRSFRSEFGPRYGLWRRWPRSSDAARRGHHAAVLVVRRPTIFRAEQERIFADTWQYAGPTAWVSEPGEYATCHAGLVPIVVVRDDDENRERFVNICRHRATEWRGAREARDAPVPLPRLDVRPGRRPPRRPALGPRAGVRRGRALPAQVAVDTWGPFVFVNRDLERAARRGAGRAAARLGRAGIDLRRLRYRERDEWEMAANWKAIVENYLECYHCPTAHPGFSKLIDVDPDAYRLDFGRVVLEPGRLVGPVLDGNGGLPTARRRSSRGALPLRVADVHHQRPPRPAEPRCVYFVPLEPGRTRRRRLLLRRGGDRGRDRRRWSSEARSDSRTRRWSSRFSAPPPRGPDEGRLLLESEHLIQHFQRLVERALA